MWVRPRSPIVPDMSIHAPVAPRLRRPPARPLLVALLLAGLLVAVGARTATADGAVYSARAAMAATENWSYRGIGHPKPCIAWTQADGTVHVRVYATGGFQLRRAPRIGAIGGMTGSGTASMRVRRKIDYRIHAVGTTPECTPCGPLSEFGPCRDAIPDIVDARSCDPEPEKGSVGATFSGSTLIVSGTAPSELLLRNCSKGIPYGVPLGSPQPELKTTRFAGAARRIEKLAPGKEARFDRKIKRGPGCKGNKGEMRSCTTYQAVIVVRRVS